MRLEELNRAQATNAQPVVLAALTLFSTFRGVGISPMEWYGIISLLFAQVQPASQRAASISRTFYDEERARVFPYLPRHNVHLADLSFERFQKDMEPVRIAFSRPNPTQGDVVRAAQTVAQSVENSGRWTIMKAVEQPDESLARIAFEEPDLADEEIRRELEKLVDDAERPQRTRRPRSPTRAGVVQGWARVATGAETCGWCLMLVSRGPVFRSAKSAGASVNNRDAMQMVGAQEFNVAEHMNAWHPGCDCKIVPVFDLEDWNGMDQHKAAEEMWREVTRGYSGQDAINAFRRATEAGVFQEYLAKQ